MTISRSRHTGRSRRIFFAALLLALLASHSLIAQNRYEWTVYSSVINVQDVAYDGNGDLWLATLGGVVRYMPATDSSEVYRTLNGLITLNASAVGIDPASGDVYIGSDNGFVSIRKASGSWAYISDIANFTGRPNRKVNAFAFRDGLAYIATAFGISTFNPVDSTFSDSYLHLGSIPENTPINDILFWNGRIWAATDRGVASAPDNNLGSLTDPSRWSVYDKTEGLTTERAMSLVVADGTLLVATERGAFTYNAEQNLFTPRSDLPGDALVDFAASSSGVAAGAGRSLYRFNAGSFQRIDLDARDNVRRIALSNSGMIAAAGGDTGRGIVQSDTFRVIDLNSPVSNYFSDLAMMADRSIWASSGERDKGAGVSRLRDELWTRFSAGRPDGLPQNAVWNVGTGGDSSIWVGMWPGGFTRFKQSGDELRVENFNQSNSPLAPPATLPNYLMGADAVEDDFGRTWLINFDNVSVPGLRPLLVVHLPDGETAGNSGSFKAFIPPFSLPRMYRKVVIDQNGTKWLAAWGSNFGLPGLLYFNERGTLDDPGDDRWGRFGMSHGLPTDGQSSLAVDADGLLWIGTDEGLSVLDNPTSSVLDEQAPRFRTIRALENVVVNAVIVDALNRKWIGTNQGVLVLSADGVTVERNFTTANSPLADDRVLSLLADQTTGDIYIGTANGMNRISTDAVRSNGGGTITISPHPFHVPSTEMVRISGLPENARVKILGLSGKLVREFDSPGGAVAFWDGLDAAGTPVPSGVYIVAAGANVGEETVVGKIAVIRR